MEHLMLKVLNCQNTVQNIIILIDNNIKINLTNV